MPAEDQGVIVFDVSKRETHHPSSGYKQLHRKLRTTYKCQVYGVSFRVGAILHLLTLMCRNNYEITEERLGGVSALIFGGPQDKFSVQEVNCFAFLWLTWDAVRSP